MNLRRTIHPLSLLLLSLTASCARVVVDDGTGGCANATTTVTTTVGSGGATPSDHDGGTADIFCPDGFQAGYSEFNLDEDAGEFCVFQETAGIFFLKRGTVCYEAFYTSGDWCRSFKTNDVLGVALPPNTKLYLQLIFTSGEKVKPTNAWMASPVGDPFGAFGGGEPINPALYMDSSGNYTFNNTSLNAGDWSVLTVILDPPLPP